MAPTSSNPSDPPTTSPTPVPPPENHNHRPALPPPSSKTLKDAPDPTLTDGLATIRPYDLTGVHLRPCARESLLVGIGSGFAAGGIRFILGAKQWRSMSWAVGAFCVTSMGAHAFCRERRRMEKEGMEKIREVMEVKKRMKVEELVRRKREEREAREEEERRRGWRAWVGWK
ncbi:MAG: hypothetical protein MMC23_003208 [Stictis urceolatum]|nr:hypothetical protein [Stictis urceolata]